MAARRFSPRWLSTGVFAEEQICAGVPSGRLSFYEWQELQGLQRPKKAARSCLVVFLAAAAPSRREREKDHAAEIQRLQKGLESSRVSQTPILQEAEGQKPGPSHGSKEANVTVGEQARSI